MGLIQPQKLKSLVIAAAAVWLASCSLPGTGSLESSNKTLQKKSTAGVSVYCLDKPLDALNDTAFDSLFESLEKTTHECPDASESELAEALSRVEESRPQLALANPLQTIAKLAGRLKIFWPADKFAGKIVVTYTDAAGQVKSLARRIKDLNGNPGFRRLLTNHETDVIKINNNLSATLKQSEKKFEVDGVPVQTNMYRYDAELTVAPNQSFFLDTVGFVLLVRGKQVLSQGAPLDQKTNLKIVLRARTEFRNFVKNLPDGTVVSCSPSITDGLGKKRMEAYRSFGFGSYDNASFMQYGVASKGKLVPIEADELRAYLKHNYMQ